MRARWGFMEALPEVVNQVQLLWRKPRTRLDPTGMAQTFTKSSQNRIYGFLLVFAMVKQPRHLNGTTNLRPSISPQLPAEAGLKIQVFKATAIGIYTCVGTNLQPLREDLHATLGPRSTLIFSSKRSKLLGPDGSRPKFPALYPIQAWIQF